MAKEINLDGPLELPPNPGPQASQNEQADQPTLAELNARVASLESALPPGLNDDSLLDAVLAIPADQLIPWEQVQLPSLGLYYGWHDGIINVRAMNQVAEKILATQRLAQSGQSIDYLFRECCRFPGDFDPANLLLGDRTFLLYYLRGITHGNMYEFAVTCPNQACQAVTTHTYDLNQLASTVRVADQRLGPEPFKIVLPYASEAFKREIWVKVRFLRGYDASNIAARRKTKERMVRPGGVRTRGQSVDPRLQATTRQAIDDALTENLERMIVEALGDTNSFKIRSFVERLHASDTATIREWLRDHTPGIDNTVEVTCPECSTSFVMELPISEGFFRPPKRPGVRAGVQSLAGAAVPT